jgi:hypothetical protein
MRGAEGALFPASGLHTVTVEVFWDHEGIGRHVLGAATVMVTPPEDEGHARAAAEILSTPDAMLAMVFGGDHLTEGIAAIDAGLSHRALRPHFAFIEAKRVGQPFAKRKADAKQFVSLIKEEPVMSSAEVARAAKIAKKEGGPSAKAVAPVLKAKVDAMDVAGPVADLVESL